MKYYLLSLTLILSVLMVGCSNSTAILMKEYKGQNLTGKSLTIIKLFTKPLIANADDVIDDLGSGIPEDVYMTFFKENFITAFKNSSCCNKIFCIQNYSPSDLEEKTLEINSEEKMKILLPKSSNRIENDSISSDFILFIDNLQISRIPGQSSIGMGGVYSGNSPSKLYEQIYFALWDNTKGKIVSYGRIADESTVIFTMTKSNWESVLKGLASKILNYSPFQVSYPDYN